MDPILGTIILFAGTFAPKGWFECQGHTLSIQEHTALFSLLSTNYGGDGISTFCIPNLESPQEGMRYIIAYEGIYPSRP
jgi:microcystin-dependent protein